MVPDLALVGGLRVVLAAGPRLRLALLFGSAAAGELREGSDVDVAILPEDPGLPLAAELALQAQLSRVARREVDLVRLDRAPTLVKYQVARHGQLLLASDRFARSRFVAQAVSEYLDFEPALRRAQERFRLRLIATSRPSA